MAPGSALANCHQVGGVVTCSADQSAGAAVINNASVQQLDLKTLTQPIAPASGTRAADFEFIAANGVNPGDDGASATTLTFTADSSATLSTQNANGIFVFSRGGNAVADLNILDLHTVRSANGGAGGDISLTSAAAVTVTGDNAAGILTQSIGGHANNVLDGSGETGGAGGAITLANTGAVTTTGVSSPDLMAESFGGQGGAAASSTGAQAQPFGGAGGAVTITNSAALVAGGDQSSGIYAHSQGGRGGLFSLAGVPGGLGGAVEVTNSGAVTTHGATVGSGFASAINALSQGGDGNGGASDSSLFSGNGGDGGHGAVAGAVTVDDSGVLTTTGAAAEGIRAVSLGGLAGDGGDAAAAHAVGGAGGLGGGGGGVTVTAAGNISAGGAGAEGVFALSQGNTGGAGGTAKGFTDAEGGGGGAGGAASAVDVTLVQGAIITTNGTGIDAESRGGTGGVGGNADAFVGVSAGGGAGGDGGTVNVLVNGAVSTSGDHAYGVLAESVGGGGGFGGTGGAVVAIGGEGGGGSKGGAVTVTSNGVISTTGFKSDGILAESIGGGGGTGGTAGGLVAIGGRGAANPAGCDNGTTSSDRSLCNDGGAVTVTNGGSIGTAGQFAGGVVAVSVGGGGGDGGFTVGAFSFGGSGGEGGNGGLVTVTNTAAASITIAGDDARGILAVSIGGGGGDGGGSDAIGVSTQVAVGGSGGNGGNGGNLVVENDGAISTLGSGTNAIHVASIGGGGGDGGDALAAGFAAFTLSVGGSGGGGGSGGAVSVINKGALNIQNDDSYAVFVQSVGGGGGDGGAGESIGASPVANLAISVGGSGGGGGNGGVVSTVNSGGISTSGEDDVALFAQSVGGGGGVGGSALATSISLGAAEFPAISLAFAVGGSGGAGGSGGEVDVTNSGDIATTGDGAHGIEAQSIGGGGGKGGDSTATGVAIAIDASSLSLTVSVGGSGGAAGDGGTVNVANNGVIGTQGDRAYGVFAQSIGGGGGEGGAGGGSADGVNNQAGGVARAIAKKAGQTLDAKKGKQVELDFTVGGSGGAAGNGGAVNITSTSAIVTEGYSSTAILAQSVGAGGGVGGAGIGDAGKLIPGSKGTFAFSLALGGNGGASGNGGAVSVTNTGSITTFGGDADGIFGQSVGGGGGITDTGADDIGQLIAGGNGGAASGDAGLIGINVNVGGNGSASGNGGAVTINQTGNITTFGDTAFGVAAQSIGGGGGFGGDSTDGYLGKVAVGGAAGAAGNGGAVTVTMNGNIVTTGNGADGVMAQSVGGGGGVSGNITGNAKTLPSYVLAPIAPVPYAILYSEGKVPSTVTIPSFVGLLTVTQNGGGGGNGGVVTVNGAGSIATSGIGADGIFAQSIGGSGGVSGTSTNAVIEFEGSIGNSGNGAAVNVSHTGGITASGADASAIFAQSVGGSVIADAETRFAVFGQAQVQEHAGSFGTGDDITVTVAGGVFGGGTGSGAGIWIDDGLVNTITVAGSATVEALSGVAIKATANAGFVVNTVDNSGVVLGDVTLAGGNLNSFNNAAGGDLAPNTLVDLAGGALNNAGLFDPGGASAATVTLIGDLVQTGAGRYNEDARFGVGPSDLLSVSGSVTLAGLVHPRVTALMPQPLTIIVATGTVTDGGATTDGGTPIVDYSLIYQPHAVQLLTNANFDQGDTANTRALGGQLQAVWNAGGSASLAELMANVANVPTLAAYTAKLDELHPEPYLGALDGARLWSLNFADTMMSCHPPGPGLALIEESACTWADVGMGEVSLSRTAANIGFDENSSHLELGGQAEIRPGLVIGVLGGAQWWNSAVDTRANLTGTNYDLGLVIKRQTGPWMLAAAVDAGYSPFKAERRIDLLTPTIATAVGKSHDAHVDLRLRAAHLSEFAGFYLKPSLDLDAAILWMNGLSETGAGPLDLNVGGTQATVFSATPQVEVGKVVALRHGGWIRPYVSVGGVFSTDSQWKVTSALAGAQSGLAPFTTTSPTPNALVKAAVGLDLVATPYFSVKAQFSDKVGQRFEDREGGLKVSFRF